MTELYKQKHAPYVIMNLISKSKERIMANQEHLDILMQGVDVWNKWRRENWEIRPNLERVSLENMNLRNANFQKTYFRGANLSWSDFTDVNFCGAILEEVNFYGANLASIDLRATTLKNVIFEKTDLTATDIRYKNLSKINFYGANLAGVFLEGANLEGANLENVNLSEANLARTIFDNSNLRNAHLKGACLVSAELEKANLYRANFTKANLSNANLSETNLSWANLSGANLFQADFFNADLTDANLKNSSLKEANLQQTLIVRTNLQQTDISNAKIYGVSAWDVDLEGAIQENLIITPAGEAEITVDNLKVAQFIYLLLNNPEIRDVIDTITAKSVLILGRFSAERKAVLDAIQSELRQQDYIPILFDFEKPASRDLTETIMTLASLSRFVIADLSDPHSIPHELMSFGEKLLSVPIQAIFTPVPAHQWAYPMYEHLARFPHVLPIFQYDTPTMLIENLSERVIKPAEAMVDKMRPKSL